MAKGATEIEGEIYEALRACTLEAAGLWLHMRHLIQESDRPGHLRQYGEPMLVSELARVAGTDAGRASELLQELGRKKLGAEHAEGWHSPSLGRLAAVRAGGARRVRRHRDRVLGNTPCNADVTPGVTQDPPPPVSPPRPLSSYPHPREGLAGGEKQAVKSAAKAENKPKPDAVPIPPELNDLRFIEAWGVFCRHRKQANDKNFTAEAAAVNLRKCVQFAAKDGIEYAVECVHYSVGRSWRGVFPAKSDKGNHNGTPGSSGRYGRNADERRADRAAQREYAQGDDDVPLTVAGVGRASTQVGHEKGGSE